MEALQCVPCNHCYWSAIDCKQCLAIWCCSYGPVATAGAKCTEFLSDIVIILFNKQNKTNNKNIIVKNYLKRRKIINKCNI